MPQEELDAFLAEQENIIRTNVMCKVYTKYVILRIRQKISYSAFQKGFTISELFGKAII